MNYRELLKKYMDHVGECEGVTFVTHLNDAITVVFTDEEVAELKKINAEIMEGSK